MTSHSTGTATALPRDNEQLFWSVVEFYLRLITWWVVTPAPGHMGAILYNNLRVDHVAVQMYFLQEKELRSQLTNENSAT
jgi:hypothetical protein